MKTIASAVYFAVYCQL